MTNITTSSNNLSHNSSFQAYLKKINNFPMLTIEEEQAYGYRVYNNNDKEAAKMLIQSHLRLVVKMATTFYKNYGLPIVDLVSEGNIGLMKAVSKFNPNKGFRLSTYALLWIKSHIQEYVLKSWSLVKISSSSSQKRLFFNLSKIKNILNKTDNNLSQQDIKYISKNLNAKEDEVVQMNNRLQQKDYSINATNENGEEFSHKIQSSAPNQEELISADREQSLKQQIFQKAFSGLNQREQHIIKMHRMSEQPLNLEELSKIYKVSKERIRQIEAAAIKKIQSYIKKNS
ncbi:RNA polymerase factor sigma-32 [Flavobacteriaceae bacterium]|nr:RNA polymerase factor sigma-32 [Flavobacteriaceae bacterium]